MLQISIDKDRIQFVTEKIGSVHSNKLINKIAKFEYWLDLKMIFELK